MVSFQCHACGDVVKKPKLDQHHGRCHTGFDCIDCSVTFNTPAEFKSHTSCVTEAEKYQKSLYKGKKGSENGNGHTNGYHVPRGGRGGGGRGSYGGRGGYLGRPRNEATGANGTPLGTPQRMSPVTAPANVTLQNSAPIANAVAPESSLDAMPISSPAKNEDSGPPPEQSKKGNKHKDQKLKSKSKRSREEAKAAENSLVDPVAVKAVVPSDEAMGPTKKKKKRLDDEPSAPDDQKAGESNTTKHALIPEPQSLDQITDTTSERKKKRKRADVEKTVTSERSKMDSDEQEERVGWKDKMKKKSRSDPSSCGHAQDVSAQTEVSSKKKRMKKSEDETPEDDSKRKVDGHDNTADPKKKKKKSKTGQALDVDDSSRVNLEVQDEKQESKESKKERKRHEIRKCLDPASAALQGEAAERKTKKRKRENKVPERTLTSAE